METQLSPSPKRVKAKITDFEIVEFTNAAYRGNGKIQIKLTYKPESIVCSAEGYSRMRIRQKLFEQLIEKADALGMVFVNDKDEEFLTKINSAV